MTLPNTGAALTSSVAEVSSRGCYDSAPLRYSLAPAEVLGIGLVIAAVALHSDDAQTSE